MRSRLTGVAVAAMLFALLTGTALADMQSAANTVDIPGIGTSTVTYGDSGGFDNASGQPVMSNNGGGVDNNFYVYAIVQYTSGSTATTTQSFTITRDSDGTIVDQGSRTFTLNGGGRFWYFVGPIDFFGNGRYSQPGAYSFRLYVNGVLVSYVTITK